jgi:hypothetical protein
MKVMLIMVWAQRLWQQKLILHLSYEQVRQNYSESPFKSFFWG